MQGYPEGMRTPEGKKMQDSILPSIPFQEKQNLTPEQWGNLGTKYLEICRENRYCGIGEGIQEDDGAGNAGVRGFANLKKSFALFNTRFPVHDPRGRTTVNLGVLISQMLAECKAEVLGEFLVRGTPSGIVVDKRPYQLLATQEKRLEDLESGISDLIEKQKKTRLLSLDLNKEYSSEDELGSEGSSEEDEPGSEGSPEEDEPVSEGSSEDDEYTGPMPQQSKVFNKGIGTIRWAGEPWEGTKETDSEESQETEENPFGEVEDEEPTYGLPECETLNSDGLAIPFGSSILDSFFVTLKKQKAMVEQLILALKCYLRRQ